MKKFLLAILSIALFAGSAFAGVSEPSINAEKKGLGGRKQWEQAATIVLVRNSNSGLNSTSIVSGDAVVWDLVSDDAVSVTLTTTSADGAFAGIAVTSIQSSDATTGTSAADDAGLRNWGYILVHGKVMAKVSLGGANSNSAGDLVITSTDSGAVTTAPGTSGLAANMGSLRAIVRGKGGVFFDAADASATLAEVFIEKE